jgi:hypothetical protein
LQYRRDGRDLCQGLAVLRQDPDGDSFRDNVRRLLLLLGLHQGGRRLPEVRDLRGRLPVLRQGRLRL